MWLPRLDLLMGNRSGARNSSNKLVLSSICEISMVHEIQHQFSIRHDIVQLVWRDVIAQIRMLRMVEQCII